MDLELQRKWREERDAREMPLCARETPYNSVTRQDGEGWNVITGL